MSRWARRAGLPLDDERLDLITATTNHIQSVIGVLRALDFGETAPATAYPTPRTGEVREDAAI